ncbi:helix-turn-helix domain-containing protein [bacterium]|nr:helix-turn-helix domain-containing protein [bacterium]
MNRFKEKLLEEGRTQDWIANKIGISKTTLSKYATGKRKPNYEVAMKIALLLNCKPDDIFFEENTNNTIK